MFYRICESMYCSIVRVRVWTALCVFKTFVLPWQRLRKSKGCNFSKSIENYSERELPHLPQLTLRSSEDIGNKMNLISFVKNLVRRFLRSLWSKARRSKLHDFGLKCF